MSSQIKVHKKLKNSDQLLRKSAFLNKFKPEQRSEAKLAQGSEAESVALTHAEKQQIYWSKQAYTIASQTNRPAADTLIQSS